MQASRALSGHPEIIPGDSSIPRKPEAEPVTRRELPSYIERGGDIVIRQPLELRGVTIHSFVLAADRDRLAALADRLLNAPAQGAVEYVPAAPVVALVCADVTRGQAREAPDRSKGWMSERDVAFWVPLWAGKRRGSIFVPERLVFFLPYVFVDNAAATTTGREVFGFPKESGVLAFPEPPGAPGPFSVDALVIRRYAPDTRAEIARIVEVAPTETRVPAAAHGAWTDVEEGARALMGRLRELITKDAVVPAVETLLHAMTEGHGPGARLVFLKQFRDVEDPSRACYQAVVEAPATVDALRGGGLLPEHTVRIAHADSHPIVADLGLDGATCTTLLATRVDVDFTMDRGSVVHRTAG
jgi:hypothetical protein